MRRRHVIAALAAVAVISVALPAMGAPSPISLAKKALKQAKGADKRSKQANKRSKLAIKRAGLARARAAGADTKAGQALGSIATGVPFAQRAGALDNFVRIPRQRVGPSAVTAPVAAARAAATPLPLFSRGQLSLYGKCFKDTTPTEDILAEVFIATAADGAVVQSDGVRREGTNANGFLNAGDAETNRRITENSSQSGSQPSFAAGPEALQFVAMAPDGTTLSGVLFAAAHHGGALPPTGAYGDGDACFFGGYVHVLG